MPEEKKVYDPFKDYQPPLMTDEDRQILQQQIADRPTPLVEEVRQQLIIGSDVDEHPTE
ncbi:MAG: hypothetical protein ABH884_03530 [Candidatus Komeilibacteria bacterium]